MATEESPKEVVVVTEKTEIDPSNIIYVGFDFGTSQSVLVSSTGLRLNIASAVGWPKDFIAYNVVQKQIIFGDECLKHRSSLDIVYPMESGVIKYRKAGSSKKQGDEREAAAAVELLRYLLGLVERKAGQKVFAVVGSPARVEIADKQVIIDAAKGLVDSILVVSEPFLVAYSLG